MAVFLQNLADLQNHQMLKRSLQEARKAKKGKFFYVPNSPAYGGPALLMTPKGGAIHPDLMRQLKKGSTPVKGTFRNAADGGLVMMPAREVNRKPFAEDVREILLSVGISVPLQDIQILTPSDVKKAEKAHKMAAAAAAAAAREEDEDEEDDEDDEDDSVSV